MTTATVIGIIVGYFLVGFALDVFYLAIKFFNTEEDSVTLIFNIFCWPFLLVLILIFTIGDRMLHFFKFIEKHVTYEDEE